jgi:hypothetical protein
VTYTAYLAVAYYSLIAKILLDITPNAQKEPILRTIFTDLTSIISRFHFVLSRGGKVSYKYPSIRYRNPAYTFGVNNHTLEDDWLVQEMQKVYKSYTGGFFFFLHMRKISYANIIRVRIFYRHISNPTPC